MAQKMFPIGGSVTVMDNVTCDEAVGHGEFCKVAADGHLEAIDAANPNLIVIACQDGAIGDKIAVWKTGHFRSVNTSGGALVVGAKVAAEDGDGVDAGTIGDFYAGKVIGPLDSNADLAAVEIDLNASNMGVSVV